MVSASLQRALFPDCVIALLLRLGDKDPTFISSIRHPVNQSIRQMKRKTDKLFRVLGFAAIIFLLAVIALKFVASKKMTAMEACIANMKQLEGAREQALLAGRNALTSTILLHNTDIVLTNTVSR
jgi:anaerobic C4-dicarboxylate transporter